MIKCENKCPQSSENKCCYGCDKRLTCPDVCSENYNECGCSTIDEENGLELFKSQQITTLQKIADLCTARKQIEAKEKDLKDQLKQAMERYGVKKFESDILNIIYVAESSSTQLDSAKVKKLHPEIISECSKRVKKSAYIKVTVKDGDE